jgi:ribonuclease HII
MALLQSLHWWFLLLLFVPACASLKPTLLSSKSAERDLYKRGYSYVLGSDESGTGSIAGPVVVATCCLLGEEETPIDGVHDSKLVTPDQRWRIYQYVKDNPHLYAWNYQLATTTDIEHIGDTSKATMRAFQRSIDLLVQDHNLPHNRTYSIVDGHRTPMMTTTTTTAISCRPWKHADAQVYTVALASIMAKCTLDGIMMELDEMYPVYDFKTNKGYPTRQHVELVHTHGLSPCHRVNAKPIKGR